MGQLYEKEKDEDGLQWREHFWLLRTSAGLGAPFLLVYLVNNWLFSVTSPEPLHIDLLGHL
ncbi:hypothetical protein I79_006315 [Cricetulus griseus]|uniref:Uncharacterized protein n=1 Tax=Cricetulus griseus TaxID=10029 RepID=G3H7I3_CRIGR|nr:hypothetical protein I79_006315 [Cricetulus griseus]